MRRTEVSTTQAEFWRGLKVQLRCLNALMVRQIMMRYGRDNLGFLWVFVEPMLFCLGVMLMWSFIRDRFEHGLPLVAYVVTGYMPLTLWRHVTTIIRPFRSSINLLYHRHVTLLDVFYTRIALEFVGSTAAFVIITFALIAIGLIQPIADIGRVAGGWLLMGLLSTGVALAVVVLSEWSEIPERFIPVVQYILLPVCGCFYMVDWLPTTAQNLAWWVPTVHCYEMIRGGFFGDTLTTFYSPWYPAVWGFGLFALSIGWVESLRDVIQS